MTIKIKSVYFLTRESTVVVFEDQVTSFFNIAAPPLQYMLFACLLLVTHKVAEKKSSDSDVVSVADRFFQGDVAIPMPSRPILNSEYMDSCLSPGH